MFADPANRIVHFARLVGAEVKNVDLLRSFAGREEHRFDAIAHVQVRFSLMAVAEDIQNAGMLLELAIEIDDVAVRVARPQQRDETEDPDLACGVPKEGGGADVD